VYDIGIVLMDRLCATEIAAAKRSSRRKNRGTWRTSHTHSSV